MNIYLAGPMRGYAEFNHPAFLTAARLIRGTGHEVFSPAEHDAEAGLDVTGMTGSQAELDAAGQSLRDLLGTALAWITSSADAVVVMPGWEESAGARAEAATALALGLPVHDLGQFLLYGSKAPFIQIVLRQGKGQ